LTPEARANNTPIQSTFNVIFPGYPDGQGGTGPQSDQFNSYGIGSGPLTFQLQPVGPVPGGTPTIEINDATHADASISIVGGTISITVNNPANHLVNGKIKITITYPDGSCWHGYISLITMTEWNISQPVEVKLADSSFSTINARSFHNATVFPITRSEGGSFKIKVDYDLNDNGAGGGVNDYQVVVSGLPDQNTLTADAGTTSHTFEFTIPSFSLAGYQINVSLIEVASGETVYRTPLTIGGYGLFTGWGIDYDNNTPAPYKRDECAPCAYYPATETNKNLEPADGEECTAGFAVFGSTEDDPGNVTFHGGSTAGGAGGGFFHQHFDNIGGSAAGGGAGQPAAQNPANPQSLQFSGTEGVQVTMDSTDSYPAELVTKTGIITVEDVVSTGFTLKYYNTGGTSPVTCLQIHRPTTLESDGSQALRYLEARFGGTTVVETKYTQKDAGDGSSVWTIYQGAELASKSPTAAYNSDFLRKTVIMISAPAGAERTETITVSERPADTTTVWEEISKVEKTYRTYVWGDPIIKLVRDPGGLDLTSTWEYYSEASDGRKVGLIKSYLSHTGNWFQYEWDDKGRLSKVKRPFLDSAFGAADSLCEVTAMTYTGTGLFNRRETVSIKGVAVSENYIAGTSASRTMTRVDTTGGTSGLTTTIARSSVTPLTGNSFYKFTADSYQVTSITYPDGTKHTCAWTYDGTRHVQTCKQGDAALTQGTKTIKETDLLGNLLVVKNYSLDFKDTTTTSVIEKLLSTVTRSNLDGLSRPLTTTTTFGGDSPNQVSSLNHGCCGLKTSTDIKGILTTYHYDHLKRRETTTSLGVTFGTQYNGLETKSVRIPDGDTPLDSHSHLTVRATLPATTIVQGASISNLAGEIDIRWAPSPQHTDGTTLVKTDYAYLYGAGTTTTVDYPDGGQSITDSHRDGRTASISGSAVNNTTYQYGPNLTNLAYSNGAVFGSKRIAANGTEWTATLQNFLGQSVLTYFADGNIATQHYDPSGQLERSVDPDGVTTLYKYNDEGQRIYSALDLNNNDTIDFATDRITYSESDYTHSYAGSFYAYETVSKVFDTGDSTLAQAFTTSITQRSVDGLNSWSLPKNDSNLLSTTATVLQGGGDWETTSINHTGLATVADYEDGLLQTRENLEKGTTNSITKTTYGYDLHNRVVTITDARTGDTSLTFFNNDQTKTATLERATGITDDFVTSYTYDTMGRTLTVDAPDTTAATNITRTSYDYRGNATAVWGDQTYASFYDFDAQGRMHELRTYQGLAHGTEPTAVTAGSAITTWNYDLQRGWLLNKEDATNKGADYTYTDAGRLETRKWARIHPGQTQRLLTSYTYDDLGQLDTVVYANDGNLTPDLDYNYDRLGRLEEVFRNGVLHTGYDYSAANLLLTTENLNQDTSVAKSLHRYYHDKLRTRSVAMSALGPLGTNNLAQHTYAYDYDNVGRLEIVTHAPTLDILGAASGGDAFTYKYRANSGNLIETLKAPLHTVTNTWDPYRNILENKRNHLDTTDYSAYDYSVNDIGQRTSVSQSGDAFSSSHTLSWTYNPRGEIETETHSDPTRNNAYQFDGIGNREKAAFGTVTLPTTDNYIANSLNEYTTVPGSFATAQDDDGNLLNGPVPGDRAGQNASTTTANTPSNATNLVWDGENRLVSLDLGSNTITYEYDYLSRCIAKVGGVRQAQTEQYCYDGWNLIALSYGTTNTPVCTFTWGLDLSGSMQGAGGVGGLLVTNHGSWEDVYPLYDGNGNACQYLNNEDNPNYTGQFVARWEFDSFGRTVKGSGDPLTEWMLHRFSTKQTDYDTGLLYYGYRWYNPYTGRWPSRDPIGEKGGINLYGMVGNNNINYLDVLGEKVYVVARDLAGLGVVGNHIYIVIFPDDFEDLKKKCPDVKLRSLDGKGGAKAVTVGGHKDEDGNLVGKMNEANEINALKEVYGGIKKVWYKPDLDAEMKEVKPPEGVTQKQFETTIITIWLEYVRYTNTEPIEFDLGDCNCATWVNTALKIAGVDKETRVKKTEFWGVDWGEEQTLPKEAEDAIEKATK